MSVQASQVRQSNQAIRDMLRHPLRLDPRATYAPDFMTAKWPQAMFGSYC